MLGWWKEDGAKAKFGIICDGAVRSGKTVSMFLSFTEWAFATFNGAQFAICGKTIISARRNIVYPYMGLIENMGYECNFKVSQNTLEIKRGQKTNTFYIYGGCDEGSAALIQGITLGGVLFDEVALMPKSFVEQAIARCSKEGAKLWFNCNPEGPYHWFYLEWVLKAKERHMVHIHFKMSDNPSLSKKTLKRYETQFSGVFYERYVLGRWVQADEGALAVCVRTKSDSLTDDLTAEIEDAVGFATLTGTELNIFVAEAVEFSASVIGTVCSGCDYDEVETAIEEAVTDYCGKEEIGEGIDETAVAMFLGGIDYLKDVVVSLSPSSGGAVVCGSGEYLKLGSVEVYLHE